MSKTSSNPEITSNKTTQEAHKIITGELKSALPEHQSRPVITEIGEVVYIGDGVCKIKGLPSVRMEDIVTVEIEGGESVPCLVLGMTEDLIEAVVMSDYSKVRQGNVVRSEGKVLEVPVGNGLLGRVVNPLGFPLDGLGPIPQTNRRPVEALAPGIAKREPVVEQFESGVLSVDTIIPLGRGQRELVIGDRKSGKTRLMASFIMNQKGQDIYCFYVAIGAQKAKVRAFEEMLRDNGAMEYTTIIMAASDDPPSLNFIAPYAGTAMAEHYAYSGKVAIIIYDDLSRHAKAYRQMSLLLKRSPGRDAYPGDIFYLHSRLLERSSKMHSKLGAGSLTGFPMAETQNGDQSEYIVTNLMSITDGHIYLDSNLLHEGILPAVNSGGSVSRIGGGVQPPALRKLGEMASSQMARYNEVKSFETLNTEINEETEREIKRGKRLVQIFGQDYRISLMNDEKTLLMYLVCTGKLDMVEVKDIQIIRQEVIEFYRSHEYPEYKEKSVTVKNLDDLEPFVAKILQDYIPTSKAGSAVFIVAQKPAEVEALPIVPDPNPKPEESKSDENKPDESKPTDNPPAEATAEDKPAESPTEADPAKTPPEEGKS